MGIKQEQTASNSREEKRRRERETTSPATRTPALFSSHLPTQPTSSRRIYCVSPCYPGVVGSHDPRQVSTQ